MVEKADVAAWLDRAGFRVVSLTLVSSDPTEPVYRVVTKEQKYFAKIIDGNTGDTMRTVLEDELSVGMPQSTLIQEDRYLLIMESADGRPLSWLIPICLLLVCGGTSPALSVLLLSRLVPPFRIFTPERLTVLGQLTLQAAGWPIGLM